MHNKPWVKLTFIGSNGAKGVWQDKRKGMGIANSKQLAIDALNEI